MKVLGISGSPRQGSTTDQLVQEVLRTIECETEFVSLAGMSIAPCRACLGCVEDNVCVVEDDMMPLREQLVEADAYVIGAPNYFSMLNAQTHCFMERWYQFRHCGGRCVAGKLGIAVGVGGGMPEPPIENIRKFFEYNDIECVGSVAAQGPASCFVCGHGEHCEVGAIHMFFGPGTRITPEIIPDLCKQPECIEKAHELGHKLSERLCSASS